MTESAYNSRPPSASEIQAMLAEAEEASAGESRPERFGYQIELAEGEHFPGRYREEDVDPAFDRIVYLLLDEAGEPCFIRSRTVLEREFEKKRPAVGDRLVIARGEDGEGQRGTFHRYGLAVRPCSDPMPTEGAADAQEDGIPY